MNGTSRMRSSHAIAAVGLRWRGITISAVMSIASTTTTPISHQMLAHRAFEALGYS